MKTIRQIGSKNTQDSQILANTEYNKESGAKKVSEVGRHLQPLQSAPGTYTTNATTIVSIQPGKNFAVYNNDTTVHSITFGESGTQLSLAVGVTDSSGHVGVPCAPGAWTYLAAWTSTFIIASSANLLVFQIDDESYSQTVV